MLHVCRILVIISLNFVFIKCYIPSLNVQPLDPKLIARKRQDTLDMCRIFTTENDKLNRAYSHNFYQNGGSKRYKRDTRESKPVNIADVENARRVESIVDKLYEDVVEDGQPVTYRQRNIETLTTKASVQDDTNKTMRRFNFAPAELLPPDTRTQSPPQGLQQDAGPSIDWHKKWKHAIVPYFIDPKTYDAHLSELIMKAFDHFERATCVRLQRLKDKPTDQESLQNVEWMYVANPAGVRQCVHSNEKKPNKGVQMVVLGYDCLSPGEIIHEVMHVLGFSHEHTRPDRDEHITILWNNIKPGYKKYFEIRKTDILTNIPYDYASVLHYPQRAFSKNGQVTITTQPGIKIGQREGLSEGDVEKVGIIFGYECISRNKQYLLKTCPSVVKANIQKTNVTLAEITNYFKDRRWKYGIVNYKLKDAMEFSAEEKENIKAVMQHIEKETCIQFWDITTGADTESNDEPDDDYPGDNHPDDDHPEDALAPPPTNPQSNENQGATMGDADNNLANETKNIDNGHENAFTENDNENKVQHGDNDNINEIASNENDNDLRKDTAIPRPERVKRSVKSTPKAKRRHASDILILAKSAESGCPCPPSGKPNGDYVLKIHADCFNSVNDLLHLFVHILGLDHQHNMHDRDSYLHILWDNLTPDIKEEMSHKLPPAASLGFEYDYQSVMHYPWLQIKNGVTNIMYPIWNDGWAMGHWQGLSFTDRKKINYLYAPECIKYKKQVGRSLQ